MTYLLDTNVVSELRKPKPHGAVVAWVAAQPAAGLHICALTIGEIQSGIELTRRQDTAKADEIEAWLEQLVTTNDILPIDAETFRIWANITVRQSEALFEDALLAACAKRHNLTVATRNVKHFKDFGVPVFNPFNA